MKRPPVVRSTGTITDSRHVVSTERLNTVCRNGAIVKMDKMTEQMDERTPRQKETSGIWVVLVFVVLLAAVVLVAIATQ